MEQGLEFFDNLYLGLKFKDAVYEEKINTCTLNFLYNPENFTLTDEIKQELKQKAVKMIGDFVKYELKFSSCPFDKRTIANHTYTTIVNNFPALSKNFTYDDVSIEINHMEVIVKLKLSPANYEYAVNLQRNELVERKLKESFLANFTVEFEKKEDEVGDGNYIEKNIEFQSSIKEAEEKTVFELSEITNIIGQNDYSLAIDYSKIKSAVENVVICGEVTNNQKRTYKKQITKNGEKTEIERSFYSFAIKNEGKIMYCSIFPKQQDEDKGQFIETGMKVCCYGSFREYNGKLNFTAQTIARCEFKKEDIKSGFKHVNEDYHTVFPQKYEYFEQSGLFDEDDKQVEGTFVVFDLETTGLESNKEQITEIGACKIVNGRIVETFSTFVNPQKHIPKEVTDLTHITDDMVKDAPTINYILPDFYKFCYGATLVGHNVQFDLGFIFAAAKKYAYNFANSTMDTMELARQKLPGLKNYKLGTVVDRLGVVLDGAHRAINDATATAKVFLKLI